MRPPLWLDVSTPKGSPPAATVALARCRNCGKVKITSNPCGFDHLAALVEFAATHPGARDRGEA